ncbi:MAG: ParB/RepB/Spo0J family partition protein [Xenococcaceae cyanobacterium MO_234.B1]|nr:ParB/RepB/Spo0J family partition protein [Xenococcaceae cyanobacterium MO_234.B1]
MNSRRNKPYSHKLKGIDAYIGETAPDKALINNSLIPIEKIQLPSQQPRRYFDSDKLEQLTQSVKEHGILEPLLVRLLPDNKYELVAGERRYRAATAAELVEVPVVVKQLTDSEALQLALVENLQREDLNPVEETEGILQLLSLQLEIETTEVVSLLYQMQNATAGKITDNVISNSEIESVNKIFTSLSKMNRESFTANRLPLLKLPQDILEPLRQGKIEYTKAKALASLKEESARKELMAEAIAKSLSLREIKERIKAVKPQPQKEEIFNRLDNAYKQVKKSKKLIRENSRKRKKLESLLVQIEKLFEQPS